MTGERRQRNPSINDVARAAGVSAQTVSRVATGAGAVREATRLRVVEAMTALGYRPNGAARALKFGRFHSIGVIMFSLESYGNMRTLDAIATEAAAAGYSVSLIPLPTASRATVSGAFARLHEEAVDGIVIVIEAHRLADSDIRIPDGLPVVVIDSDASFHYPVVDTDQNQGARLATEHLLALGHQTVWHVAGPQNSYSAHRRRLSWERTLQEHRAAIPPVIIGDWTSASGLLAGARLAVEPEVTAVFAANDQMALGVLNALHTAGRRVPEDISVVGFDDLAESAAFWPPLTTIRQDFALVGQKSLRVLLSAIEHQPIAPTELVPTKLIIRESTAEPPSLRTQG
ncbi:LacI family DNA-binding transcriptional regulator [Microbacteriaceae bacterium VKM Ac-2855]|nr:LacI family DNA-binding transcriptional regulator [Microbacteriaceae bacterium VKM Ac-2855]